MSSVFLSHILLVSLLASSKFVFTSGELFVNVTILAWFLFKMASLHLLSKYAAF